MQPDSKGTQYQMNGMPMVCETSPFSTCCPARNHEYQAIANMNTPLVSMARALMAESSRGGSASVMKSTVTLLSRIKENGMHMKAKPMISIWVMSIRPGTDQPIERGPFYALGLPAGVLVTFGGIHVDTELRALDVAGRPIPGLYAAGEVIGGGATSGVAFCGGMLVTPAISFGRILGRTLAAATAGARATA